MDEIKLQKRAVYVADVYAALVKAGYEDAAYFIQGLPSADVATVVRCKDCVYARPLNDTEKLMYLDECKACYNGDATSDGYNIVMPEHFCSYGKKRGTQLQREDV